jgi:predicted transcriptional regulator
VRGRSDRDAAVVIASPASAPIDEAGLPFSRRCHAQQFSAATSGTYCAKWFSGRRRDSLFVQQIKTPAWLLPAMYTTKAMAQQRYDCLDAIVNRAVSRGHHCRRLITVSGRKLG